MTTTLKRQYPDVASSQSDVIAIFAGYVCVGTVPVNTVSTQCADTVPVKQRKMTAGVAGPTRQLDDVTYMKWTGSGIVADVTRGWSWNMSTSPCHVTLSSLNSV